MSDISILILACNKSAYTRRCLTSLLDSSPLPFQIVLVDNGSSDDTPQIFADFATQAAQLNIQVKSLRLNENLGAIVGRNRGMDLMNGQYWVFLDNDVVIRSRNWLKRLRAELENNPHVGMVGPKLIYPLAPHNIQCAGCAVTPSGQVSFLGRGHARTAPEFDHPKDCQTLISACWMMRADIAKHIGPLDEQFSPVQFEDIDYCYRFRDAGWLCRYIPDVEMYHFENVTTSRGALNYPYITVKNGLKFKNKWRHCFSKENGLADADWSWAKIDTVSLEDVPEKLDLI